MTIHTNAAAATDAVAENETPTGYAAVQAALAAGYARAAVEYASAPAAYARAAAGYTHAKAAYARAVAANK